MTVCILHYGPGPPGRCKLLLPTADYEIEPKLFKKMLAAARKTITDKHK